MLNNGVLLIRLAGLSSEEKAELVVSTLKEHAESLEKAFSVLTPGSIRIRPES